MDREKFAALEAPFQPEEVKTREGNFGKLLDYVEGHSVIRRLNSSLGGDWSFEIVEHMIREEEVIVIGKLRAGDSVKMQVGSSRITRNRDTREIVSLGEDLKAATTDCLKKCATLLGVALYLYGGNRPEEIESGSAAKGAATPRSSRSPSSGNASQGRLSSKQHQLILKLASEKGMSRAELNEHCQKHYNRVVDFLTRTDASALIEAFFAGAVKAA